MLYKTIVFSCDNAKCKNSKRRQEFVSMEEARSYGWAISRDRVHCYCPDCAPMYRNVGRAYGGVRTWAKDFKW